MLFVEARFFLFFALVFALYWSLRINVHRKILLLGSSYFFYGCWDWRFAIMLFAISLADYFFARAMAASKIVSRRKLLVTLSVVMNMGVLCYFKYFNFFAESFVELCNAMGLHVGRVTINVILPVGVSFFTFQALSYTIDVYRGTIKPARLVVDYMLSSSFFPQLVAGPIVRPAFFLPQLARRRDFPLEEVRPLLALFFLGFLKKACLADNISPYVDRIFSNPHAYADLSVIGGVWLYAAQIYCDFSGYSDMAIATAGLLGYKLVLNFNAPYLSVTIQDFWRRWHISLSEWIRDYIYISLGGRSQIRLITYRNLLITMLLGGLWHGAAWTFVVWGGLHGLALVVQRDYRRIVSGRFSMHPMAAWFITINFVCICWIFFRASSISTAWEVVKSYLLISPGGTLHLSPWLICLPPVLVMIEFLSRQRNLFGKFVAMPPKIFAVAYGSAWAVSLSLLPLGYRPFIYFQF